MIAQGGPIPRLRLLWGFMIVAFGFCFFPVLSGLISVWIRSEQDSHGLLVIPVSAYMVWRERRRLADVPLKASNLGFFFLALALLTYLLAFYAGVITLASVSMVLSVAGVIVYALGFRIFMQVLFPWFLLFFMIPVPAQIYAEVTIPLQLLVSKMSVWIVGNLGLPIYREGNVIYLPGLTLEVVQACSGMRYMVSLLVLAAVFGHFTMKSNVLRGTLFVSAIPISIVVNTLRVLALAMAWNWFNYDLTKGTGHTLSGILVFVVALLFMVLAKEGLSRWDQR